MSDESFEPSSSNDVKLAKHQCTFYWLNMFHLNKPKRYIHYITTTSVLIRTGTHGYVLHQINHK